MLNKCACYCVKKLNDFQMKQAEPVSELSLFLFIVFAVKIPQS